VADAFPLDWPPGWPRTQAWKRKRPQFNVRNTRSFAAVRDELFAELRRMGVPHGKQVLSTNVELRQDGIPYANRRMPDDPGVAIYFTRKERETCIACDKWEKVEWNIWAIVKTLDAIRGIERWGASDLVDRAFSGFQALCPPAPVDDWWEVLECDRFASREEIETAFRKLARQAHPDMGGSADWFSRINAAHQRAISAVTQ